MENSSMAIGREIFALADRLKEKRQAKKDLESQVKKVNAEIEQLDRQLSDAMAEAECPNFAHSGSTFYLNTRLYASPKSGMAEELISALKEHGYGDIVRETVNAQTLASFYKEQIALSGEREEFPDWLAEVVSTFDKVTVGIRKARRPAETLTQSA